MKNQYQITHEEAKQQIIAATEKLVANAPDTEAAEGGRRLLEWMKNRPANKFVVPHKAGESCVEACASIMADIYTQEGGQ